MNSYKLLIISLLSILVFTSCEDVIELELNNTEPRVIIEGRLDMTNQTANVIVSKSNDFYDVAEPILVSNAMVTLTTPSGENRTLTANSDGSYELENITASPGDKFTLSVESEGQIYSAEAIAPFPVGLTSLDTNRVDVPFGDSNGDRFQVFATWNDMVDVTNYYRLRAFQNDSLLANVYTVISDDFSDGKMIQSPVRNPFEEFSKVDIELLSTDKNYYDFFVELSGLSEGGLGGTTPYNPSGNFDNKALGYFGIYSSSVITIQL